MLFFLLILLLIVLLAGSVAVSPAFWIAVAIIVIVLYANPSGRFRYTRR